MVFPKFPGVVALVVWFHHGHGEMFLLLIICITFIIIFINIYNMFVLFTIGSISFSFQFRGSWAYVSFFSHKFYVGRHLMCFPICMCRLRLSLCLLPMPIHYFISVVHVPASLSTCLPMFFFSLLVFFQYFICLSVCLFIFLWLFWRHISMFLFCNYEMILHLNFIVSDFFYWLLSSLRCFRFDPN